MIDVRDVALGALCPVAGVPLYGALVPSTVAGERLWLASNGLFVEIVRPWCRFVRKIGDVGITVPYGKLDESSFLVRPIPGQLLRQFFGDAQRQHEIEIGASIIWHEHTGHYRLAMSTSLYADASRLDYEWAALAAHEHRVVDLHSHGHGKAYFSEVDDVDDADQVKLAWVIGDCHRPWPTNSARWCLRGRFEPIAPTQWPKWIEVTR